MRTIPIAILVSLMAFALRADSTESVAVETNTNTVHFQRNYKASFQSPPPLQPNQRLWTNIHVMSYGTNMFEWRSVVLEGVTNGVVMWQKEIWASPKRELRGAVTNRSGVHHIVRTNSFVGMKVAQ